MTLMINRPNRVIEKQKFFQAHTNEPLWLRGGSARKPFLFVYFAAIGFGTLGSLYGATKLARGTK
ncbi:18247_t:CDS:2 [Acaulospora morrowiae]|uniref:18247_t:CDS:1 n=1 Tax=Acaulospora morrowiae TaxID=94023 RepID=A0A9N8W0G7_9GLOM|nr:18247_t:CDS:2 [Acaulospora morrowiae]